MGDRRRDRLRVEQLVIPLALQHRVRTGETPVEYGRFGEQDEQDEGGGQGGEDPAE
jgi:hypothetical protein